MVDLLNAGITPIVPEYGSLGASGDLAPLAHGALALLGEGDVHHDGRVRPAAEALGPPGCQPIELAEKEGLAVTNGTDAILGMLCLAVDDARRLLTQADMVGGDDRRGPARDRRALRRRPAGVAPAPRAGGKRRQPASDARRLTDRRQPHDRRPAGAGRLLDPLHAVGPRRGPRHARPRAPASSSVELASAIDNPMVLADGRVESCGNFHGAPLGFVADFLAIALAEIGAIAERRMDRMLDRTRSHGLPPFLADEVGVDSGLMIGHYTAAAMASENKRLAAPASVDSLPTSGMQEDHVSMGLSCMQPSSSLPTAWSATVT